MGDVTVLPGTPSEGPFGPRDGFHYLRVREDGWDIQHSVKCYERGDLVGCWTTAYAVQEGERLVGIPGLGTWAMVAPVFLPEGTVARLAGPPGREGD